MKLKTLEKTAGGTKGTVEQNGGKLTERIRKEKEVEVK
jgi:hypothetical protein